MSMLIKKLLFLELLLILRNNRAKKSAYTMIATFLFISSTFFCPYLKFIFNDSDSLISLLYFVLIPGLYLSIFGIVTFSFWGSFFNLIITNPISIRKLFLFKYFIFVASIILLTLFMIIVLLLAKITTIITLLILALWNIGITSLLILIFASYNIERCNLNKGIFFNFEAWGFFHNLILWVIFFIPVLLFQLLSKIIGVNNTRLVILIISILFILFSKNIIYLISKDFIRRKYKILEIFRKDQ